MRDVLRGFGRGVGVYGRCEERDARRLHEAGLAVAVVSCVGIVGRRQLQLFATTDQALKAVPPRLVMRR